MLNSLLAILPKDDGNFYFDNIGEAFVYALIGFLIVFAGIILIIFIIWLVGLLMRKTNNLEIVLTWLNKVTAPIKRAFGNLSAKIKGKSKSNNKPETEQAESAVNQSEEEVPDEVKAAIVAALMAYYSSEAPKCEFKVKRIKRI